MKLTNAFTRVTMKQPGRDSDVDGWRLQARPRFTMLRRQVPQSLPPEQQQQQGNFGGDSIRQLNLTPEQREQIRAIARATKLSAAGINQRVREAKSCLEEALDATIP